MQTQIVAVDPRQPEADKIACAADVLRRGGLVAFPTETVYGLGGNALDQAALRAIFEAKGRPPQNPLIVHVSSIDAARRLCTEWPISAQTLAERFWPGPLTLVLRKTAIVPELVTAGGPTVAIRVPAHPVALALLKAVATPLAAPSANRSTQLSPTLAQHVLRSLDGRVAMILDAGPTSGGLESTVLDVTVSPPKLLRPGLVSLVDLETAVGTVSYGVRTESGPARSPGMQGKHYSPRTALECMEDGTLRVAELKRQGLTVMWVRFTGEPDSFTRVLPNDPAVYGARIYATLHELDEVGADRIVVDLPPALPAWFAVRDRLLRAAAP